MTDWIPPTLSKILGSSLEAINRAALERLIDYPETESIDFKRDFPTKSDGEKRELCDDLVQFANHAGGLIVFGMDEKEGVATKITPMLPDDGRPDRGLWIDQVLASGVVPHLNVGCNSIKTDDGTEVLVVSVPPSVAAPHAAKVNEGLRYAVRAGRHKRFMPEHEIAERYRARFDALAEGRQLGEQLHARSLEASRSEPSDGEGSEVDLWLVVSASPDQRGSEPMRRGLASEWERLVMSELFDFPTYGRTESLQLSPRYRSMTLDNRRPYSSRTVGELNLDGTGAISQSLPMSFYEPGASIFAGLPRPAPGLTGVVRDDYLVADLMNILNALAHHALRCGAHGALVVTASLHVDRPGVDHLALITRDLDQLRLLVHGSLFTSNPTEPVQRSIFPESVVRDPLDLVESVRLLAGDLCSHFGIPESHQFNNVGDLQPKHFDSLLCPEIERWLATANAHR